MDQGALSRVCGHLDAAEAVKGLAALKPCIPPAIGHTLTLLLDMEPTWCNWSVS